MRKIIAYILVLTLCLGLCACGGDSSIEVPTRPAESVITPTRPESVAAPENSAADAAEEATESDEGKYPWEVEFREEDYVKFNFTAPNGDKIVTWREGSVMGMERRCLYEWAEDGTISDSYYYPSGNKSHEYTWYPDGSYVEFGLLDDGYTDLGTSTTYNGTVVYQKNIYPDGTVSEQSFYENGNPARMISISPDGIFSDTECYENGNVKRSVYEDTAGNYSEQECYENGAIKYVKNQSPEQTNEEQYDEEGYRTYYYTKSAEYEMECISDETGKLVKVIENGEVKEDAATIARCAADYNFRQ